MSFDGVQEQLTGIFVIAGVLSPLIMSAVNMLKTFVEGVHGEEASKKLKPFLPFISFLTGFGLMLVVMIAFTDGTWFVDLVMSLLVGLAPTTLHELMDKWGGVKEVIKLPPIEPPL